MFLYLKELNKGRNDLVLFLLNILHQVQACYPMVMLTKCICQDASSHFVPGKSLNCLVNLQLLRAARFYVRNIQICGCKYKRGLYEMGQ